MRPTQHNEPASSSVRPHLTYQFHGATPAHRSYRSPQRGDYEVPPPRLPSEQNAEAWLSVMLTLARPDNTALDTHNRGELYQALLADATAQRTRIQQWLAQEGLTAEVSHMGDANTFHVLFLCCTPRVAERLQEAPGVIDIAIAAPDKRGR